MSLTRLLIIIYTWWYLY